MRVLSRVFCEEKVRLATVNRTMRVSLAFLLINPEYHIGIC